MKKLIITLLLGGNLLSAQAQLFNSGALHGAFLGSLIGGIAGGDCRNGFSGNGAAIGAGVGLLAGAIANESRRNYYYDSPGYPYAPASSVSFGYGYGNRCSSSYVYYSPNSYCAPGYYYRPTSRPNYAVGGTLLGAASGALIGAGHRDAGKGAAIGAAAGLVLGGIAEHSARKQEQRVTVSSAATTQTQSAPAVTTQDDGRPTRDSSITSEPGPTSTYHWAPRPQIADAPRVPDAPTF